MTHSAAKTGASHAFVRVRGAREHNLKNVDVDIPRDKLVVFSGVSGSGKSSLAFATIYAEAQRRYFESVAPYARRLIDQVGVPAVDAIEGLPPAVALQQQRGTPSARSSVGSATSLSSLMRMLYSRAGHYPAGQPMLYAEDFSPNTPQGACPGCHGLGRVYEVTERSLVPDDSLTIRERAVAAWPPAWHGQNLRDILVTLGIDVDIPWRDLPKKTRDWILFTDEQPTVPVYAGFTPAETHAALKRRVEPSYQGTFMGARKYVLHTFATTQSALMKRRVSRYLVASDCPACEGKRLKRESLSVTFAGLDIGEMARLPLNDLANVLAPAAAGQWTRGKARAASRDNGLSEEKRVAAQRMAQDMLARIRTLNDLGLGYLSLDRGTPTLSSGELQRLRLATQIRANLFGVIYVLDEPSAGLHPADGEALMAALKDLKDAGNSLFIVEHDIELIREADWLVDVGPDAGERVGRCSTAGRRPGCAMCPPRAPRATCSRSSRSWLVRVGRQRAGWSWRASHATTCTAWMCESRSATSLPSRASRVPANPAWSARRWWTWLPSHSARRKTPRAGTRSRTSSPPLARRPAATSAQGRSASGGSCAWTSNPSAARRARIWRPTRACSTTSASCSPRPRQHGHGGMTRAASRSTSPRAAATPARVRAS